MSTGLPRPTDTRCPFCRRANPLHSRIDGADATPDPGDFALCWKCAMPSIFERPPLGVLFLRAPTVEEDIQLGRDATVATALAAMRESPDPEVAVDRAAAALSAEPEAEKP